METKNQTKLVVFQFIQTILNFGLSIMFVVWLLWHWQGRLIGIISSLAICFLISIYLLYKKNI